ncbi:MAG: methyltransferase domain-containing protein [Candidatus Aenigmarchaeota archaeon]|nr:methyltransferase domain-containing protein [Candidatus Aenigmarchaeota archaeon]
MEEPVYVTEIAERKPKFTGGVRVTLPLFEDGLKAWWNAEVSGEDKCDFTLPSFRSEGMRSYYRLLEAIRQRDAGSARDALQEMKRNCMPNFEERPDAEKWAVMGMQLPGDWGPRDKKKLKDILTVRARGMVLEAMCGFRSYFGESDSISEVVALDFCRELLERYSYPERRRILYDLERVARGERMDFFEDGSFQTVGVCFGMDYLSDPVPVYREFHRILSKDGLLLVVGGTTHGYKDVLKRSFNPELCAQMQKSAGFETKLEHLPLKTEWELGEYYLVEGKKGH